MSKIGSFTVTIRVRLNQDVTPEVAREFVNEMDYELKDTTGKVSIAETEVIDTDIEDGEGDDSGLTNYDTLSACIASGAHLQSCDTNGYCNNCGYQESGEDAQAIIDAEEDQDFRRGLRGPEYKGEKF